MVQVLKTNLEIFGYLPTILIFGTAFQKITLPKIGTTPPPPTKEQPFQRKLSRREKKELKKQEKLRRANEANELNSSMAEKLYTGKFLFYVHI